MRIRHSYVARRRFLCGMLGGGVAAMGGTVAGPVASYVGNFRSEPPPEFAVYVPADYDVAPGQSTILRYGPLPVLVLRTPEPEKALRIFVATCTHLDCIVAYKPEEDCIFCACHEGRFDLAGRVLSGPPPAPLRALHHRFRGDKLVLALEKQNLDKAP